MYPVLFHLGKIPVHSYYLVWTAALCLALEWTRHRAENSYGMGAARVSKVLFWGFIGMMIGARLGGYLDFWEVYAADPRRILRWGQAGMST